MGPGGGVRHLHGGRRHRGSHQPGDHAVGGAAQAAALEKGAYLLDRADRRRLRRGRARVRRLQQRDQPLRPGQPHHQGTAEFPGYIQHLRHVPGAVLPQRGGTVLRRSRRHLLPRPVRVCGHRRVQPAASGEQCSLDRRVHRDGGRYLVRRELGIRDQPRSRFRPAAVRVGRRLGEGGVPRRLRQHKHLLLDPDRRAFSRRRDRVVPVRLRDQGHPDGS